MGLQVLFFIKKKFKRGKATRVANQIGMNFKQI